MRNRKKISAVELDYAKQLHIQLGGQAWFGVSTSAKLFYFKIKVFK